VDLLFAIAVPEDCSEDHLKLLAQVAELFSDPDLLKQLREAEDPCELLNLLSSTKKPKHN
jgi:PTS system nitrogen regulatory IIA component